MFARRVALPLVLVLVQASILSCGDRAPAPVAPAPGPAPVADPSPKPAPKPVEPPLPTGVPDSVAGHQLAWVIDVIVARHGVVDATELEAHFHPSFLAQVPVAQAAAVFAQLAEQLANLTLTSVTANAGGDQLLAKIDAAAGKLKVALAVDPATKLINGLLFQPDLDLAAKPTTFAEAEKLIATLAPRTNLLVASIDGGTCKPLHEVNGKDPLALGSTFKLYVLLAVVDQILAGKLTWDTEIAVRDDWKSLPSGVTQNDPAGTKLSVKTLAERMISISDNTATDHLLYTVGRKKVEAALKTAKHSRPKLDVPFMSTRELFLFKLALTDEEVDAYLKLGADKRRAMLDGKLAKMTPTIDEPTMESWKDARRIDTLEWFATSGDLCRVMATLATRAKQAKAAPLLDVIGKNPGLDLDKKTWPFIGFKGGSEPGVMNLTWLLRRDDDKWFFVTIGVNGPTALDENKVLGFATGVLELTAAEGR